MNTLIYSINPQSPHLETDLELAIKLKGRGDNVTIVRCTGELRSCLANPKHNRIICAACRSKYSKALQLSGLTDIDIISLPSIQSSYDILPKSFQNIDELRNFKIDDLDAGNGITSTLVSRLNRDHKFNTLRYKSEIYTELQMWVDAYNALTQILEMLRPDEVYFFNGRFSTYHPLRLLCIKNRIAFYTHERGGIMNRFILRRNALPHNLVYTIREVNELWDNAGNEREQIGAKFFTDRRNSVIQSWVSFVESQEKGLLPPGFNESKRNIVIFNSTMEEYEGMEDWVNQIYKDDNEGIRQILESFKHENDYKFYLRIHPNLKLLKNSQMREIYTLTEQYPNLHMIKPEETYDTYALMDNASKVVTFGSTAGVEATFWGKVSILLGKSNYMNIDACYEPSTHEEGVKLIMNDSLIPKSKTNAIKYGHWELAKGQRFETFTQLDLFTMSSKGEVIAPIGILEFLEKLAKIELIRNKRDIDNLKQKLRRLVRWK